MPTVLQLSDLHLGRMPEQDDQRCAALVEFVKQQAPDLVVISGDLCDDAPCQPQQVAYGKALVDALEPTTFVVPGNHDVGNKPGIEHDPLTPTRYEHWQQTFGPGWFRRDFESWTVLGINSQIVNSGFDAEREQEAWLAQQIADCERCVVFTHMPLDLAVLVDVHEDKRSNLRYWPVDPPGRSRILEMLRNPKVRLVCSGHLHNLASLPHASPPRLWCPSLSFGVIIPGVTGAVGAGERIGAIRHELTDSGVASTFVPVDLPVSATMTI